jgi:Uma2 family endonuclease
MSTMPVAEPITAEEYLANPPEGRRTELVDGVVIVNEPRLLHQRVMLRILTALGHWTTAAPDRGEVSLPLDVRLDDHNVFAPDILWYADGHVPADAAWPYPIPDLAVEIRSPSTWRYDIGAKKRNYERHGVAELWLVDTAADVVLVFRRSSPQTPTYDLSEELDAQATLTSPLLPGFALPVAEIFGD